MSSFNTTASSATATASASSSGGVGFAGLLTALFTGLKLTHYIDWSWWWVTSPLWISAGLGLSLAVIALLIFLIVAVVGK